MAKRIRLVVDSHIRIARKDLGKFDEDVVADVDKKFTRSNPKWYFAYRAHRSTKGIPQKFRCFALSKKEITVNRGGVWEVKKILHKYGFEISWDDRRLILEPVEFNSNIKPWETQEGAIEAVLKYKQGIIRGPCSAGKTFLLCEAIARAKQPAMVICWESSHQIQWVDVALDPAALNLKKHEVGGVGGHFGHKATFGKLNICMQQSLYNPKHLEFYKNRVGFVGFDEVQRYAARTMNETANQFPALYRIGVSADEKRTDNMQSLIYNSIGRVRHEMKAPKESRIASKVFMVPTKYFNCQGRDDMLGLITPLCNDKKRNSLIVKTLKDFTLKENKIALLLTKRINHVLDLYFAISKFARVGLVIGSACSTENLSGSVEKKKAFLKDLNPAEEEKRVRKLALKKNLDVIIATQKASTGFSVKSIDDVHVLTPSSLKEFEQQKGRCERTFPGKVEPRAFYYWDKKIEKMKDKGILIKEKYNAKTIKPKRRN